MKPNNPLDTMDDFGDFQPFFFEDNFEETLYDLDIPAPSEDIWKKFELLPTPPRSPKHEPVDDLLDLDIEAQMELVSQILEDDPLCHNINFPDLHNCSDCQAQRSLMDPECMWSTIDGFGVTTDKNTESRKCSRKTNSSLCLSNSVDIKSSECVDPTAVFPYPVATLSKPVPVVAVKSAPEPVLSQHSLGIETPSDSEQSSSDDDTDDDDDDEEEIDVVTVGQTLQVPAVTSPSASERVRRVSTEPMPRASSMSAQVAAMHNYTQPRPAVSAAASAVQSTHSYASLHTTIAGHKRSRAVIASSSSHGSSKRVKLSLPNGNADLRSVVQKLKHVSGHRSSHGHGHHGHHSRSSSDSEDCDKRAQHNVLERKRRNDLKSSFMVLRDEVPDLLAQERAAKVVILKKASEHILSLKSQERSLDIELIHQKRKHEQLKQKLAMLQRL